MWIYERTDLLIVGVFGPHSFVQQHWCGEPLPGQRQRQISSQHDHLPIADHLPTVEQHGGRRQVSGFSWKKVVWLKWRESGCFVFNNLSFPEQKTLVSHFLLCASHSLLTSNMDVSYILWYFMFKIYIYWVSYIATRPFIYLNCRGHEAFIGSRFILQTGLYF